MRSLLTITCGKIGFLLVFGLINEASAQGPRGLVLHLASMSVAACSSKRMPKLRPAEISTSGIVRGRVDKIGAGPLLGVEISVYSGREEEGVLLFSDEADLYATTDANGEFAIYLPHASIVRLSMVRNGYEGISAIYQGGVHCVRGLMVPER